MDPPRVNRSGSTAQSPDTARHPRGRLPIAFGGHEVVFCDRRAEVLVDPTGRHKNTAPQGCHGAGPVRGRRSRPSRPDPGYCSATAPRAAELKLGDMLAAIEPEHRAEPQVFDAPGRFFPRGLATDGQAINVSQTHRAVGDFRQRPSLGQGLGNPLPRGFLALEIVNSPGIFGGLVAKPVEVGDPPE